jgi:hypothetical protein
VVAELDAREADLLTPLADALAARGATAAWRRCARVGPSWSLTSGAGVDVRPALAGRAAVVAGAAAANRARAGRGRGVDGIAAALAAAHDCPEGGRGGRRERGCAIGGTYVGTVPTHVLGCPPMEVPPWPNDCTTSSTTYPSPRAPPTWWRS